MDKVASPSALGGHTPGPWLLDSMDDMSIEAENGTQIAVVCGPEDYPCLDADDIEPVSVECAANARLIAAAPDILAALIALNGNIGAASLTRNPFGIQLRAQADAAIAKATGKD